MRERMAARLRRERNALIGAIAACTLLLAMPAAVGNRPATVAAAVAFLTPLAAAAAFCGGAARRFADDRTHAGPRPNLRMALVLCVALVLAAGVDLVLRWAALDASEAVVSVVLILGGVFGIVGYFFRRPVRTAAGRLQLARTPMNRALTDRGTRI